ncbi:hypothetical protein AC1031_004032 [Aphanomyces cochlioides]|nr:hypothetical protein AC1031_004032 [Aphanomyces cochlioides]
MVESKETPLPPGLEKRISWDDLDKTRYYIIGPSVMVLVRAAVYPSNLVKTRLQVQSRSHPMYNGTFDAFRKIVRQEGFLGLYKGFGANLLNIITGNLYITMYEIVNQFATQNITSNTSNANFIAGSTASVISQTVVVPLDIVSQRMMLDGQGAKSAVPTAGVIQISKNIFRQQGILGFYKGYIPSVMTYAPSSGIWWGSYGAVWPFLYTHIPFDIDPLSKQIVAQALGGGSAGVFTAIVTNPMDVIRTRTQVYTQYSAMETLQHLIKTEGPAGLFSGVFARVLSMGPSGVLVVSAYELVKRLSRKPEQSSD